MASRTAQHTAQIFTDPFSSARNNAKHDKERKRDALYLRPHQRPIQRSRDIHRPSFNSYGPSSHSGDRLDHPARPRHASLPADFVSSSFGLGKASGSGFDGRYPNHPSSSHSKLHRQSTPVQSGFESSRDRTPPQPIREHLANAPETNRIARTETTPTQASGSLLCLMPVKRAASTQALPPFSPPQNPTTLLSQLNDILLKFKDTWGIIDSHSPSSFNGTSPKPPYHACSDKIDVERLLQEHNMDRQVADMRAQMEGEDKNVSTGEGNSPSQAFCWRKPMCMVDVHDLKYRVFGQPLHLTRMYASCVASMAGYQHDLPIVVFACVEELYRTGMTVPGLFRSPPDRIRYGQLIDLFDFGPSFGHDVSLAKEVTADVCAMLRTYFDRLPEPVFHSSVYDAFWTWCVAPTAAREQERAAAFEKAESHGRTLKGKGRGDSDAETPQIDVARILFRLLPAANLSLLSYLCAFFTQIPLSPRNQLGFEDIARFFAVPLLGRGRGEARKSEARTMMVWILRRWSRISEGLFDCEGADAEVAAAAAGDVRTPRQSPSPPFFDDADIDDESFYSISSAALSKSTLSTTHSTHSGGAGESEGADLPGDEPPDDHTKKGSAERVSVWRQGVESEIGRLQQQLDALKSRVSVS